MKISAIKRLCVSRGICRIFNIADSEGEVREQWISNGVAVWRVDGLPMIAPKNIGTLFGLTPKATEKLQTGESAAPAWMLGVLGDLSAAEIVLQERRLRIVDAGVTLAALRGEKKTVWINPELLEPCQTSNTALTLRHAEDSDGDVISAVAAFDGFFLTGLVLPVALNEEMLRELRDLGTA